METQGRKKSKEGKRGEEGTRVKGGKKKRGLGLVERSDA